jgi:serine/threonine-protein kinase RsbW
VKLDVALCLPRESETVSLIRRVISDSLRTFGVTEECVGDVALALSEACTNVVEHAAEDDEYEVRLVVDGKHASISVSNTATGVDAEALTGVLPDDTSVDGRGVAIMRAVMDRVDFVSEPERGTIVHLVKELDAVADGPLARLLSS